MLRVTIPKKIAFIYLANDLIQKSVLKQTKGTLILNYQSAFDECIDQTLELVFDIFDASLMFDVHLAILKVI